MGGIGKDESRQAVPMNQPDAPERPPPPDAGGLDSAGLHQLVKMGAGKAGVFRRSGNAEEFRVDGFSL